SQALSLPLRPPKVQLPQRHIEHKQKIICALCASLWLISLLEALDAAESALGRLRDPTENASGVVAVPKNVITRRKTMLRALRLHLVELFHVELVIAYDTPVMRG